MPHAAADYHPRTQNSEKPDPQVDIVCQTCSTVEPVVTWVFIPELVNFLRVLSCERQVQLGVTAVANLETIYSTLIPTVYPSQSPSVHRATVSC